MTIIKKIIALSFSLLIASNVNAMSYLRSAVTGLGNYFCPTGYKATADIYNQEDRKTKNLAFIRAKNEAYKREMEELQHNPYVMAGERQCYNQIRVIAHNNEVTELMRRFHAEDQAAAQAKAVIELPFTKTERAIRLTETLGLPVLTAAALYASYRNPESLANAAVALTAVTMTTMESFFRFRNNKNFIRPSLGDLATKLSKPSAFVAGVAFGAWLVCR